MSVVFEPRRAKGSAGAGVRWFLLFAVTVVVLGVVKPWGDTPNDADAAPPAEAVRDVNRPTTRPALPPLPAGIVDLPRWAAVAGAVGDHDEWGVAAIADNPAPPNAASVEGRGASVLVEMWQPVDAGGGSATNPAVISSTTAVRLVRPTAPDGPRVDRYDVDRLGSAGRWEAMPFVRLQWFRRRPALLVPSDPGRGFTLWRPGTYRIEVQLADGTSNRLVFRLESPTLATR